MAIILHIEASPRGSESRSSQAANVFLDSYLESNRADRIDHLNVFEENLPAFDGEGVSQKMAHIADLMQGGKGIDAVGRWAEVIQLIERLKSADKVLLSSPLWNFSIPYRLKHYFDLVCQPALTFYVNRDGEYKGLVKNKPMQLILSSGSAYNMRFPHEDDGTKTDFQLPYLRHIARFIGFEDVRVLKIQPTDAIAPKDFAPIFEQKLKEARDAGRKF